jgi:hypothetical protein
MAFRDFSLLGLAYGFLFLSPRFLFLSPRFLFENHNYLTKVSGDFWFAVEIFKINRQIWFSSTPLSALRKKIHGWPDPMVLGNLSS